MAKTFRYGAGRSAMLALIALALAPVAAALAIQTYDPLTEFAAWVCMVLALGCAVIFFRQVVDPRPAIELAENGVYVQRFDGLIEWGEIDGIWLRRRKARVFYVVPADSVALVFLIKPNADFWERRGRYRRILRAFARFSGNWATPVSLSGMRRSAQRRLERALKEAQPELLRDAEIIETSPRAQRSEQKKQKKRRVERGASVSSSRKERN